MQHTSYKILLSCIIFTLWSCGDNEKQNNESETQVTEISNDYITISQAQFDQSKMVLGRLEEKQFPNVIKVTGMIDVPPENKAVVSATMGGYIKTTPLLVGDKVKKGQVLVTIENPEFVSLQQQYMEVTQQLTYLKAEYERQKTMVAENITSQKSFLKAESDYNMATTRRNALRKQLAMLNISIASVERGNITSIATIYAPISGNITKVNVTKGTYVSPASPILEIIDNDHIHLELSVFEKNIMKVSKEQKIEFRIPEASTETFKAEVYLVGTIIEENRTIKVHGHLENEDDNNFLTGMFVDARIFTDMIVTQALPSEAVVSIDDVSYVLVLEEKQGDNYYFKQMEVKVKASYKQFMIIESTSQFEPQTEFLTRGAFHLIGE